MSKRLAAVESAKRLLVDVEDYSHGGGNSADIMRRLIGSVRDLLEVVEGQPRSVRLAAQHDEEFRNLVHAARLEIHAARGALSRLDAFEGALSRMLWPDEDQGAGRG